MLATAIITAAAVVAAAVKSGSDDDPAAPTIRHAPAVYVTMVSGSASARGQRYR
jgi:hypothetical protein